MEFGQGILSFYRRFGMFPGVWCFGQVLGLHYCIEEGLYIVGYVHLNGRICYGILKVVFN